MATMAEPMKIMAGGRSASPRSSGATESSARPLAGVAMYFPIQCRSLPKVSGMSVEHKPPSTKKIANIVDQSTPPGRSYGVPTTIAEQITSS